jgi:hypothetical protein
VLRQIARLTRNIPAAGERSLAVAVYADAVNATVGAREAGDEGVACVDDAARALEVYCDIWDATKLAWALRWCEGLLDFILYMQEPDGRWVNFVHDWSGTPNRQGRTSVAGGGFWQSRALLALARAARTLNDARIDAALWIGLPHIVEATDVPSDVRALHVLTALTLMDRGADLDHWSARLSTWCDQMIACRNGDVLMNADAERGRPHLWGHIQEGVLADAGARLGRDDLISAASGSADALFPDVISGCFDLPRTQPYDVASAIYSLTRLGEVTGRDDYLVLAADARAWFDGRNPSHRPVYDRDAGRVGDGLDGTTLNTHSGAESNIAAAQALPSDTIALAMTLPVELAMPAGMSD